LHAQNVGVGTTSPQSRLHIIAPSGYSFPLLRVETDGSANPYLIVQPDGKVGIGVSSPSEALDVSGNVQFTGALMPGGNAGTTGFVLMSQGVGNPPVWVDTSLLKDNWGSQVAVTQSPIVGDGTTTNPIGLQSGTNAGDVLIWDGSQWQIKASPFDSVCGIAMTNYVQKWTGSELCNSQIYDNGSRVGIRTSSPAAYVDIDFPSGLGATSTPLFRINAPGNPVLTVYGLGGIRKIGVNTSSPEDVFHVTYAHGGSWPYFRSIVMGPLGGIYEGEYIGWNAKILPDTQVYFIKLGGGTGGAGEQEGGAVIVTDRFGNMHFQTYNATSPGKDTMPDTVLFQPQITFTNTGDIVSHKRGGTVTGVKWNPLGKIHLGTLPLNTITTVSYNIPVSVPPDAKEVLVYMYARTGVANPDSDLELRIYTKEGTIEYSYYLLIHGYNQSAWSYNSDNLWLPVTSDRKIYVQSIGTRMTGYRVGNIYVLGYR